ncbi:histidine kinase [Actinomadura sp. NBRC 104425]|uniref:sensor histidine kinase n=1 Tax=Actinomadura sp. NBRC 104425 TaxID=3032204 RepID=UPI0024A23AAD|nr:sensor histidine kinase [Actinomadura sp. NBRC 104425]GLZ15298.1 histidine kinase [Actinomadura sp. NBRC 104425]
MRARAVLDALEHLVSGLSTALPAFIVLTWLLAVALLCAVGVGFLLAPTLPRLIRALAERERARLSRWGTEIPAMGPVPAGVRAAFADPVVRRELRWLPVHGTLGLSIGGVGATLAVQAAQDITYPLWWRVAPREETIPNFVFWSVRDDLDALAVAFLGLALATVFMVVIPGMARLQAWPGRRLLAPPPDVDLSLQVARLSATRAAALDAHAQELRRIERTLHDGTQNRLVAVNVLLGATRRALARDPAAAEALLEQAQDAAETAMAELRTVLRGILPPVLADRGLAEALAGLAANCGVPCRTDIDIPERCAASAEATAYFVAAEALTNVSRHSRARNAALIARQRGDRLSLRIEDDGIGGADASGGSGLAGIRSRIEAHGGRFAVTSPPGGPTVLEMDLPCGP